MDAARPTIAQTISPPTGTGAPRTELSIGGMTCSNCARHVTEALQGVPGVEAVLVSLEQSHARVRWAGGALADAGVLVLAVQKAGFTAKPVAAAGGESVAKSEKLWGMNVFTGILPTALLMAGEWIFGLGGKAWFGWTAFALAAVVQFGPGRHFYRGAWRQLKVGASNMDTLVALGSTTAFGYSAWALFSGAGGHLY